MRGMKWKNANVMEMKRWTENHTPTLCTRLNAHREMWGLDEYTHFSDFNPLSVVWGEKAWRLNETALWRRRWVGMSCFLKGMGLLPALCPPTVSFCHCDWNLLKEDRETIGKYDQGPRHKPTCGWWGIELGCFLWVINHRALSASYSSQHRTNISLQSRTLWSIASKKKVQRQLLVFILLFSLNRNWLLSYQTKITLDKQSDISTYSWKIKWAVFQDQSRHVGCPNWTSLGLEGLCF